MSENSAVENEFHQGADSAGKRELLSAFVITYNEESNISDCLKSLEFCDEVIVIDSFSTDETVNIARSHGAKVIQREWPGFREQKAYGLSITSYEWVLNLDADERVSPKLREEILKVLSADKTEERAHFDGYYLNRVVFFLGRWWRKGGWYPEYRLRLLRKSKTRWGGVDPHEKPFVEGQTKRLSGELHHFTYRSIDDQLSRLQKFASVSARAEYERGSRMRLHNLFVNPLARFLKFFFIKRGFREGLAGFVVAVLEAYYTFIKYARLWELEFVEKYGSDKTT